MDYYKKKYDEALGKAEEFYNDKDNIRYANAEGMLEEIFPELKEPEDEQIRKYLIRYIDNTMKSSELKSKLLAWLEKQGEQKHAEWSKEDDNCLSIIIAEFSKCSGRTVSKYTWMRCNDFLNSLKDRVSPQPKQEWNEEDEEYLNFVIDAMKILQVKCTENEIKRHSNSQAAPYYGKVINWLKSLKQRIGE